MPFPEEIVVFPTMKNITANDGDLINQYQQAIKNQDASTASAILASIPEYSKKIITATYLNSIGTTVKALEEYYINKFSPSVVVSASQPGPQAKYDMWFEITGTET